jgi:PAS domain S-box-containing protein
MDYSDRGVLQQLFVDSFPDYALVVLDVDGKVLTWNAGAQAIHGYPESEIVGRHFSCLYIQSDIDADKPMTSLADAIADGRLEETRRRLHKDGTEFEVQDILISLYSPQKKLVAFGNLTREVGRSARLVPVLAAVPASAPGSALAAQGGRIGPVTLRTKVLLVDDDEDVRTVSVDLLTSLGYQVIVASSGPEALELLARHADIDVLFTDVVMPDDMDGGEVAERARQLRPDIKVLFTSGYFEGALVRKGSIAANTHFLVKPYRKRDLAQMMEQVLASEASAS